MWNAGKENLFATVSQDERKEREVVGFQSYTLVIPPFPYMMLAVTMAALAVISRWGGSHPYVALS